jgi:GST-like protein
VESGAILLYLAEKSGTLLPPTQPAYETIQWVMWQMAGLGPMTGQMGFFHKFAGRDYEDKRPRDRFAKETARLLRLLDDRFSDRQWVTGDDFTIADISMLAGSARCRASTRPAIWSAGAS